MGETARRFYGEYQGEMTAIGKAADMLAALRQSADGALRRLSGAPEPSASPKRPSHFDADPTEALFSGESGGGEHQGSLSLSERLRASADGISERDRGLSRTAAELALVSDRRSYGEKALNIWTLRFLTGAGLIAAWVWMQSRAAEARASGADAVRDAPITDYLVIAQVFGWVGLLLTAAAFLMICLVFALGNGTNGKLRRAGSKAGEQLAGDAKRIAAELEEFRRIITDSRRSATDILPAVSQAHLSALAAKLYFRKISFLTDSEATETNRFGDADAQFARFLGMAGGGGAGVSLGQLLFWVTVGYLAGAASTLYAVNQISGGGAPVAMSALSSYGWAWTPLLGAIGFYAVAGVLVSFLFDILGSDQITKARSQTLDAVRSAYLKAGAPVSANITERVDNAVDVLRGRLTEQGQQRTNHAAADFSAESEVPEWRRRDSSVKFVGAGFSPAPERWRTDAYAKKFEAPEGRSTGSKRGGEDLKKGAGD